MKDISTYHLVAELLSNGKGNLYPHLEPFDLDEIFVELSNRSKTEISSKRGALKWCLEYGSLSEEELGYVKTMSRIYEIEEKAKRGLGKSDS